MKLLVYDLETYPNIFTFCGYEPDLDQWFMFEVSDRKDQTKELVLFLSYCHSQGYHFVGYNNLGFDYPIIHELIMNSHTFTYEKAAQLCQAIITNKANFNPYIVPVYKRIIPQIDLYKQNHFDNKSRRTSLKSVQVATRAESVEDLPFEVRNLTHDEKDVLVKYNFHDVLETARFFKLCGHMTDMRRDLLASGAIEGDVLNYSDVKIGTEYLIKAIGRDICYIAPGQPRQTVLKQVYIKDVILPKIEFQDDSFQKVLDIYKTKPWMKDTTDDDNDNRIKFDVTIRGVKYDFGIGGIHASVQSKKYETNDEFEIIDLDVASLYPSISIANGFYPMHLGEAFVHKYADLKVERFNHAKGTPKNAMFKLALNGAFGNSNNPYSPFYDPSYLLKITINGQLQLLQLAEMMSNIPKLEIIQVNTDGITCYVPREDIGHFEINKQIWQTQTGLDLEEVKYKRMWIRDVNNYMSETMAGKIKAKGAYAYPETIKDYDGYWNKDYSSMVVQKAIRVVLMDGVAPEYVVRLFTDPFDFMLKYKTPNGANVYIGDKKCSKTVRYYVAKNGHQMVKIAQPKGVMGAWKRKNGITDAYYKETLKSLPIGQWDERIHTKNKSKYEQVQTTIESNSLVALCNNASDFDFRNLDYDYYIKEIKKLII